MKPLKGKISRSLVLCIVLFSSVVTLMLTAIQLWLDYNKGIDTLEKRIEQIEITNTASITQSMWTIDNAAIKVQLDGLIRINDIIFVQIHNEEDLLVASSGSINTKNIISRNIPLYKNYRHQQTYLGTLNVIATKENLYSYLIDTIIVILISQGIKTFLVTLFILLMFHYLVTRHLVKISKYSGAIDLSKKPVPLVLDRKENKHKKPDELSLVVDSINSMSDSIYENYNHLLTKQKSLSEREARFSSIFDAISDAAVFADTNRNITQINPAFSHLFGYSIEELEGRATSLLYANPEDFSAQGKQRYNASINGLSLVEVTYRRKDGSVFPSETMGGPIKLNDGTQIGYIAIIRDISARKQAEDENALLQFQLSQAQKMEAIGQLTGGIAHDFNNILSSILGYSELASHHLQQEQDGKLLKYINNIHQAGERARELVAQLLAFSRSTPDDPVPLNLQTLIDDVISILTPILPSSIDLIKQIDPDIPRVLIDETQMHQILMNLCINARDAMNGHGQLSISLSRCSVENAICASCQEHIHGDYVKLSIADTGTGIQPDILQRIFDPFLTTKDVGKGTGMGLSVVHGILHGHQAHILIDTTVGKGSRFDLLIPPILNDQIQPVIETSEGAFVNTSGSGKHILIVDDEAAVADFLKDFLQAHQFTVTAFTNSEEAMQLFSQNSSLYDLVITDQTMPQMTGIQLAEKMLQQRPDLPVVLCSGYSEHANEEIALKTGCAKFLRKPVSNQHLLKVIFNLLKPGKK